MTPTRRLPCWPWPNESSSPLGVSSFASFAEDSSDFFASSSDFLDSSALGSSSSSPAQALGETQKAPKATAAAAAADQALSQTIALEFRAALIVVTLTLPVQAFPPFRPWSSRAPRRSRANAGPRFDPPRI